MASTVWIVRYLWLIPALPILAAGVGALLKQSQRRFAATIAITSIGLSFVLAVTALAHLLLQPEIGAGAEQARRKARSGSR